jgi:hypothetical protein
MARLKEPAFLTLAIGLLIGGVVGWNHDYFTPGNSDADLFESIKLNATATENHDNFAIATGLVDGGVEALYFLDYLTGDLKAAVINPKTGTFAAFFTYNISQDFGGAGGGSPKYLMVTGLVDMPRGRAGFQLSKSALYIADATSGTVAAYIMPWNSSMMAAGKPQTGTFQRLDIKQFRTVVVRDQ